MNSAIKSESPLVDVELKGLEQGLEQGKAEGEKLAKLSIAKNLLGLISNELIAEKTGLSLEEVASGDYQKYYNELYKDR
ncbi:MAG: hypothetical protein ACRDAQ_10080 [Cetobacterium sp.]